MLPIFHSLIGYPKNMSHLNIGHFAVNPHAPKVLPKGFWMFSYLSPNPPIR